MANIKSVDVHFDAVDVVVTLTKHEYKILMSSTKNLVLLPTDKMILNERLTTGKIGNGNRIMMPNKILRNHEIEQMKKKVASKIFDFDEEKYLLIRLQDSSLHSFIGDDGE